jgi:hypothetical protein
LGEEAEWKIEERNFTTKGTARQSRNQRNRKISRKGRKEKIFIRTWRSSRPFDSAQDMLGGRNIRIRDVSCVGKFAQAAKTLGHSGTKNTKQEEPI